MFSVLEKRNVSATQDSLVFATDFLIYIFKREKHTWT